MSKKKDYSHLHATIAELYLSGKPTTKIAKELNIGIHYVKDALAAKKIPLRKSGFGKGNPFGHRESLMAQKGFGDKAVKWYADDGYTIRTISLMTSISTAAVRRFLLNSGVTLRDGNFREKNQFAKDPKVIAKSLYTRCGRSKKEPFKRFYDKYKKEAPNRKLSFELSLEEFTRIMQGNCYYCNAEPSVKWFDAFNSVIGNGVDRRDNSIGYTLDNAVPCCKTCNYMKRDMEEKDFIDKCVAIAIHKKGKK